MRTNKLLFGALATVALVLSSCSAASVVSGNYNGNYSSYTSSGSASAAATIVNDNTAAIKVTADGIEYNFGAVSVTKTEIYGVVLINGNMSNSDMSMTLDVTQVNGIKSLSLNMDSTASSGYLYFDSTP